MGKPWGQLPCLPQVTDGETLKPVYSMPSTEQGTGSIFKVAGMQCCSKCPAPNLPGVIPQGLFPAQVAILMSHYKEGRNSTAPRRHSEFKLLLGPQCPFLETSAFAQGGPQEILGTRAASDDSSSGE